MTDVPGWPELEARAAALIELARSRQVMVATAESCTGGLVAGVLTQIPGSSAVFERGFVTYSNAAKASSLGIEPAVIERYGAVSEEVAREMALGALAHSQARIAVSVTGVAGPGGGSPEKPVGLVHFATANRGHVEHRRMEFGGRERHDIRFLSVAFALEMLATAVRAAAT